MLCQWYLLWTVFKVSQKIVKKVHCLTNSICIFLSDYVKFRTCHSRFLCLSKPRFCFRRVSHGTVMLQCLFTFKHITFFRNANTKSLKNVGKTVHREIKTGISNTVQELIVTTIKPTFRTTCFYSAVLSVILHTMLTQECCLSQLMKPWNINSQQQ